MHPYYYFRNGQKDIIGLFDANRTIVARYAYDSWGNLLKITDGSGNDKTNDTAFVGYKNPLRYRGYYYDSETKLYYLQSRYYNPEWGRFINADGFISTGQGLISTNMFAYCNNNPAMFADPTGYCAKCRVSSYNAATMPWSAWERHMAMYPELIATVGSAKPYQSVSGGSNTPNCYAYAIGVSNALNPGNISGASPTKWNNVNDMASSVMADIEKMGRSVRKIDSYNSTIYNNEYRIALRVGTQPYGYYYGSPIYDYHLMVETSSGQWAEKHGTGGSSLIWAQGYNPTTIP